MNHLFSRNVCRKVVRDIVRDGGKIAQDHHIIKTKLFDHANDSIGNMANNLMIQTGVQEPAPQLEKSEDNRPVQLPKDNLSYRCINNSVSKHKNQRTKEKSGNRCVSPSPSVYSARKKAANKHQSQRIFIPLYEEKSNGRVELKTKALREQKLQDRMREQKLYEKKNKGTEEKEQEMRHKQEKEKKEKADRYLKNYMSRKGNRFTFDEKGKLLYFNTERQTQAIRKKYPPTGIKFCFDEEPDLLVESPRRQNIKERAAKGEAFASTVLKTMNVSAINMSMNTTSQIDEYAFMKRNDLFNNNHIRQTTNIPYLSVAQGTSFTESNTNACVSRKSSQQRRTTHSETKVNFKTHGDQKRIKQNFHAQTKSDLVGMQPPTREKTKKRAQSSYLARPKTSETCTHRGRITSINQQLVISLLE